MTECWAIWDSYSYVWHSDVTGNIYWWPNKDACEAQIEFHKSRAIRLHGSECRGWFDHAEARILAPISENQTKKPAAG